MIQKKQQHWINNKNNNMNQLIDWKSRILIGQHDSFKKIFDWKI